MFIRAALVISASFLATQAIAWDNNGWGNDNNDSRQNPSQDPVDTHNARGQISGDVFWVEYDQENPVNEYHRLCDFVARVQLKNDDDIEMTESAFVEKQIVRRSRSKSLRVPYRRSDSPGFRFVKESQQVHASCLRWEKEGIPNPGQNPAQRPHQNPNQVCDPQTDHNNCGNTCRAQRNNSTQCESNGWSNDDMWR